MNIKDALMAVAEIDSRFKTWTGSVDMLAIRDNYPVLFRQYVDLIRMIRSYKRTYQAAE